MGLALYLERNPGEENELGESVGADWSHLASWSYSGFSYFRGRLAEEAGLGDLDQYKGFGGRKTMPEHPLKPLLNHSDCDGQLTAEECRIVAPAIVSIVSKWDKDEYDYIQAKSLVEGMVEATRNGYTVQFA